MKLKKLFIRGQNILLLPVSAFSTISEENHEVGMVNRNYLLPVTLLVSIFSLIGSAITNISSPISLFPYVLTNAVIVFMLIFTHAFLSGKAVALLGQYMAPEGRSSDYYALTLYAQLPFFLILAFVKLFPSLIFFVIIGAYSVYLFNIGCSQLTKIPKQKILQFTLLSTIIIIGSFVVCSELYTLLYTEIIAQFSTFAGH
ncbi:MAG: YIP1 family protein [Bacteroidales bacterium]